MTFYDFEKYKKQFFYIWDLFGPRRIKYVHLLYVYIYIINQKNTQEWDKRARGTNQPPETKQKTLVSNKNTCCNDPCSMLLSVICSLRDTARELVQLCISNKIIRRPHQGQQAEIIYDIFFYIYDRRLLGPPPPPGGKVMVPPPPPCGMWWWSPPAPPVECGGARCAGAGASRREQARAGASRREQARASASRREQARFQCPGRGGDTMGGGGGTPNLQPAIIYIYIYIYYYAIYIYIHIVLLTNTHEFVPRDAARIRGNDFAPLPRHEIVAIIHQLVNHSTEPFHKWPNVIRNDSCTVSAGKNRYRQI